MKEKIKLIILIVVFVGLLIMINNMLKDTEVPLNTANLENVSTEKNIKLESNVTTTVIASNNGAEIENQVFDSLESETGSTSNEIGKVTEVTESTFDEEVLKSDKTVLIDFYADWCNPCKILSPIVEEVAKENPDLKVVKIDVDSNENLAYEYRTYSIPTLVVIKAGKEVNRSAGVIPKEDILDLVK